MKTCFFVFALAAIQFFGCGVNDPWVDCPRPKLLFAVSQGQTVRDDSAGNFYGIIQKHWTDAGNPAVFWVDSFGDQSMNLRTAVYDATNVLVKQDTMSVALGIFQLSQSSIRGEMGARAVLWLETECGSLSTHQIELVP